MSIPKSGGHWQRNQTVRAHRKAHTEREQLERAQARAEEYIGDVPDMREQVTEIMQMLAQPPREQAVTVSGVRR